ncbi:hypothetical protein PAHAL_5G061700 [Panicum hallii]|jgi:hypothetical protein|uniref:Receptor-like serine/threonine-protein kinase n=1 Tax=Panicum hallii TaxID=206008 RepID=A0A2T8IJ38_9POAL|nr:hypothetical protein PAHAL_5G061700 [Panicum hallii]
MISEFVECKKFILVCRRSVLHDPFSFYIALVVEGSDGKWYIGIWYNKIPGQTLVWVANREKPVSDPVSSNLIISDDGNLVILSNHSESPTWSTNIKNNKPANSTIAVLLNTGNLVVRHGSNTSIELWQSFDDITDTWLPGNKLSRNKKTGIVKRMTSWKDRGDPTPGMFSIGLDPKGSTQYVLLWNNSVVYWASGNWTGNSFNGVPELSPTNSYPNSGYTFQFVDNDEETYFTYTVKSDVQIFTRAIIDVSGLFQAFVWMEAAQAWVTFFTQPKAKCSVYGTCGENSMCSENAAASCSCLKGFTENNPNNWVLNDNTAGCRRNVPLKCVNNSSVTKQDRFYLINNVKLPDSAHIVNAANIHDCELICLSNCSCTAYSHNRTCLVWHNHLMNLQDSTGGSSDRIFIRLDASEIPNSGTKKWWIICIIIGGFIILSLGITIIYFLYKRSRIGSINQGDGPLISFKYSDLQFLTRNFSERLGAGSFGTVFKGVLPDTTTLAVKKLEGFHQGEKQFRAEVSTIGNIHHMNLIRLLGFCSEGAKRLLVYEYMPNGSLDKHLFDSGSVTLNWKIKHQIAVGIAKGLAYLHEECRDCIIHCDIKPQNILLDASFVPKVADFGLAKLLGRDFSRVLTSMRGTVGYLAPEWISGEAITTKADVFSYGMMLFEIISGKRNLEHSETNMETFFPVLVARKLLEEEVHTLFGSELTNDVSVELERACKVACWCVQDSESSRPTMGEVVKILEGLVDVAMPPVPRYLNILAEGSKNLKFFSY